MMMEMMELYHICTHCVTAATVTMKTTTGDKMEIGTATLTHCQTTVVMLMMRGKMMVVMMVRISGKMMKTMVSRPSPDKQKNDNQSQGLVMDVTSNNHHHH